MHQSPVEIEEVTSAQLPKFTTSLLSRPSLSDFSRLNQHYSYSSIQLSDGRDNMLSKFGTESIVSVIVSEVTLSVQAFHEKGEWSVVCF